ncbi:right-handed parallel beta-helix repeat-containing protein [Paenibacillus lignilyticus]|uniref:Right-handed parallel beta-helix repeat-containing protein n=1 Tax=Paenibacillus lignilyticus TaxID=1172615 RepID=A0ABS5C7U2_9BACL|nr:right-handed parallel beta-helix repeat-containing protein [Paenibacillus lignilyticus]MBP3962057.1 right-handed parallel beta-helix repeat-containing protein [Paenibacillus lignilyticus]
MTKVVQPYAGMIITEDVVFEPGEYSFPNSKGLIIAANGITVDGSGAIIRGRGKIGNIHSYDGTGLYSNGYDGVTVKGLALHGFKTGMKVTNGSGWVIENNDLSDNYTDPDYGWGDGDSVGALMLERVSDSVIAGNAGNRVWNGLDLKYADRNRITGNNFSHCTNVCLKLWGSSNNEIDGNVMSYGIRIAPGEVHARDSTSVLIESGSNDNRILNNDFTYGGDGVFIRSLNGFVSTGNYFEGNDASYAHNNAWEVWDPGNVFVRNLGNHSSYGFWLGGSCHAVLIENEAAYNGLRIANAPEKFGNAGIAVVNGSSSHFTMRRNRIHHNKSVGLAIGYKEGYEACHWIIEQNEITDNDAYGIYMKHAKQLYIAGNRITGNGSGDIYQDINVSDVIVSEAEGEPPIAKAALITDRPRARYAVQFDASASRDASGGDQLTYRWDMGDGTVSETAKVEHIYEQAGFYRVGLTVIGPSGTADLDWIDLNVLHAKEQIKHRVQVNQALLAGVVPNHSAVMMMNDDPTSVGDGQALQLQASSSLVKLQLPVPAEIAAQALTKSNRGELSFWIKFSHETWGGFPSSAFTVRLKQDDGRYVQWVSARPLFEWTQIASEARNGWSNIRIPLSGEQTGWVLSDAGNPDRNELSQLELQIASCGGNFTVLFDEIVFV